MSYGINYDKLSNQQADRQTERKVAQFLDQNFYPVLQQKYGNFRRCDDKQEQVRGVDLYIGDSAIDEKVKNASTPNVFKNYFASLEIYQKYVNGQWEKGWFVAEGQKTTHYAFLYNFEDSEGDTEKVIMALFRKHDMTRYLDFHIGMKNIVDQAYRMEHAFRGQNDVVFEDPLGHRIGKLTKSREGAAVFAFYVTDLQYIGGVSLFEIRKGRKVRKLSFDRLQEMFTE